MDGDALRNGLRGDAVVVVSVRAGDVAAVLVDVDGALETESPRVSWRV